MNTHAKLARMLCIGTLSLNLVQSPVQSTPVIGANPIIPDITMGGLLASGTAGLYLGYNYLVRQDWLVENKFPVAYSWYQTMTEKYPKVGFNEIQFLQVPDKGLIPGFLANYLKANGWVRHENKIYFSESSLQEIQLIFQKIVDGAQLTEYERKTLSRHEFALLHEAGHIKHRDAQSFMTGCAGLAAGIYGTQYAYKNYILPEGVRIEAEKIASPDTSLNVHDEAVMAVYNLGQAAAQATDFTLATTKKLPTTKDLLGENAAQVVDQALTSLGFANKLPNILSTSQGVLFVTGLVALLRDQEAHADQFACAMADTQTLQEALSLFENDTVDTLYNVESKTVRDYVPAQSQIESIVQTVVEPVEYTLMYAAQQFYVLCKTNRVTRWLYDFTQNPLNQGPSVRAQLMRDEIRLRSLHQN